MRDTPYTERMLSDARGTECPGCGPTTWVAGLSGLSCCGCGEDLEGLLPPLCRGCGGSRFLSAGGGLIGTAWCHYCNGTGLGPDFRALQRLLDAAREKAK